MEKIKAIKTELGEIHGRDAIFLDDIQFNYQKNEVTLIGEINGLLCTESDDDCFLQVKNAQFCSQKCQGTCQLNSI
ncbi:hypothetical protein ABU162_28555 [Paenibacillus thiaminolyticus]|uniref:hypothetical protein n=1 Tax=Paenibacillus thiaminolyticus TaxID=49283 RepID=UPI0035A5D91F